MAQVITQPKNSQRNHRSEGFPRAAYFVPGRDGIGVWPISEIVTPEPASAAPTVTNTSKTDCKKTVKLETNRGGLRIARMDPSRKVR